MEAKTLPDVPTAPKKSGTPKRPPSKSATRVVGKLGLEMNSFKECIVAFAKNLEVKSATCEELQELFFKMANANKSLPENVDSDTVNSFIAILVTVVSVNYGYPVALQALSVLFCYLKNDDRVFSQFKPTKDILVQLNFDKYLATEGEEGKELVLDFVCFMLRYYKDIGYSDLSADPKTLSHIRKAELERTWTDIENIAVNQENMAKATEQNQLTTSNAFAELFAHVEDLRKHVDSSVADLRREFMGKTGGFNKSTYGAAGREAAQVDTAAMKKLETGMNEKMGELRRALDAVLAESSSLGSRQEVAEKKLEDFGEAIESMNRSTQEIMGVINSETQLIKDARSMVLSRISKTESDLTALTNKMFAARSDSAGTRLEPKEMANLRIDSIRNQLDGEVLPKLNELQVKLGSFDVMFLNMKQQQTKAGGTEQSALLSALDERAVKSVSELIKTAMDAVTSEARGYKKLIEATRDQVIKLQEANEFSKSELRSETEAKLKQVEGGCSSRVEGMSDALRQNGDKIRILTAEADTLKRQVQELFPQVKSLSTERERAEQRLRSVEEPLRKVAERISQFDDKLVQIVERFVPLDERIKQLESRPSPAVSPAGRTTEDPAAREELQRGLEQAKQQMQGYFDSCWTYIQQFADLHAVDKSREVKTPDGNYTAKLNCLEWLIRYHEYLSGKSSLLVIDAFKETIHPSKIHERGAYAAAKHVSDVMGQLVVAIRGIKKGASPEETRQTLTDAGTYLAILEVALVNDQNVDAGIGLGVVKDLVQFVGFFRAGYDPKQSAGELKLTVRCLTYCFRNVKAIDAILDIPTGLTTVVALIQGSKDEEMVANSVKIIRVCLRSDKQYDKVVQKIPTLLSMLMQLLSTQSFSAIILEESTAAIRNYTRKVHVLDTVDDPIVLAPLCKLAADKTISKQKEYSIGALRNCCKNQRLLSYIKQTAAYEFVIRGADDPSVSASIQPSPAVPESKYYS